MDDEWKMKRLQALIDEGALVQDPDGKLWLSPKMRALVKEFNEDEEIKKLLSKKAKDQDDYKSGAWSYLYMLYVSKRSFRSGLPRSCESTELNEAVAVLKSWDAAAEHNLLDEWSMGLRLH